jgi:hypothetical protein
MQRHLRRCPACTEQKAAEEKLGGLLAAELAEDSPEDRAAIARLTERWRDSLTEPRPVAARVRRSRRGLISVTAVGAAALAVFVAGAVTAPTRAIGAVSSAMAKVKRFHVRMELPNLPVRYEAWGERDRAARVEEWQGDTLTLVMVDDGKRLRSYDPQEQQVSWGKTRFKRVMRQAMGFSATKMLRRAAQGELFEGQEWVGEAQAREVAQIRRNGLTQRRIQIALKDGFFARMVVYAEMPTDRLTQANLYLDGATPDEQPDARVFFDYPDTLDPVLFKLKPKKGATVRYNDDVFQFP